MYSDTKTAQIAAYLIAKSGQKMAYLKLIKLMYLADREALAKYGQPVSFDSPCSMPHGPVLSRALNLLTGQIESDVWSHWVSAAANFEVSTASPHFERDDFDELSNAELAVLDDVWTKFGHMGKWQLVEYTHQHLAEWEDPKGSSRPIAVSSILKAVGRDDESAAAQTRFLSERRKLAEALGRLN